MPSGLSNASRKPLWLEAVVGKRPQIQAGNIGRTLCGLLILKSDLKLPALKNGGSALRQHCVSGEQPGQPPNL
jgi:hypothetical protein